jgi:hypothetical protein
MKTVRAVLSNATNVLKTTWNTLQATYCAIFSALQTLPSLYIEPINDALERVFGQENGTQVRLLEIIPPLKGNVAQINFEKGKYIYKPNTTR